MDEVIIYLNILSALLKYKSHSNEDSRLVITTHRHEKTQKMDEKTQKMENINGKLL